MKLLAKLIGCSVFLLLLALLAGPTLLVEVTPKLQHKADLTPESRRSGNIFSLPDILRVLMSGINSMPDLRGYVKKIMN